jgi:hypothetical protein
MLKWFLISILISALVFVLQRWVRDLLFYRSNNWDFTKDSGFEMYFGDEFSVGEKMSNRVRIIFGYSFFVFVISLFLFIVDNFAFDL